MAATQIPAVAGQCGRSGRIALMVAHCAGMIDMVALPIWVSVLIDRYGFDPTRAGALVTLFLVGVVAASLLSAPWLNRLSGRKVAGGGFALAAVAFFVMAALPAPGLAVLAPLHLLAGLCAGSALSFTHGTIGRSADPHARFAEVGIALGVFGVIFIGTAPRVIEHLGGAAMFQLFGLLLAIASAVCALAFPTLPPSSLPATSTVLPARLPRSVWGGVLGVACMAMTQATVFSFLQQIGLERGFGAAPVTAVLVANGLVSLLPAPLAALLQRRLEARRVLLLGPALQVLLALTVTCIPFYAPYALAGSLMVSVMLFTHTFAFGLLSRLDPSGRAVAATPAMLMTGSALGPIVGGALSQQFGYPALGLASLVFAAIASFGFARAH